MMKQQADRITGIASAMTNLEAMLFKLVNAQPQTQTQETRPSKLQKITNA